MKVFNRSIRGTLPYLFLVLAFAWSTAVLVILTRYHIAEPLGVKSITTNGHTYFGNPPALTLPERDPASFAVVTFAMGFGLVACVIDLVLRVRGSVKGWGYVSVAAGAVLVLLSFFGLLIGVATVGFDGILLALVGAPVRFRDQPAESQT
jgi:hypothetical protein